MTIEYDGSNFKGFQRLKDNDNTIQGKIEDVLSKLTNEKIEIIGSGRTDMGVHAVGQVVNFKTNCSESVENQASDRAHRIGQRNVVEVIKLITKGTIEEKIIELQNKKKELIDNMIDGNLSDNNVLRSLSEDEIMNLLK